ncbi:MAG: DUF488 family protein [Chloroflexi bacterium]|nr:DUF488 family protein [Chloroflexota bacterium]
MALKTKRAYEPRDVDDGYRLLVMRRWPRGVPKRAFDAWQKEMAPSEALLQAYLHGGLPWEGFGQAYLQEMASRKALVREVAHQARRGTVTLLCSCLDESRCHRTLLKTLVEGVAP